MRRVTGTAIALASLGYAISSWSGGDQVSLILLAMAGVGFGVVGWLHPLSPALFTTLTASLILVAIAVRRWWLTGLVVGFIALLLWLGLRRQAAGIDPDSVGITDPDAFMPGAKRWIAEFEALGYRHVASTKAQVRHVEVTVSLLLSSDRTNFAAVTDSAMAVTSAFENGRLLETRNSAYLKLPPWMLDNPAPGAGPRALVESHARACAVIAERGADPLAIADDELAELAVEADVAHIRWVDQHPQRTQDPSKAEPLWHRLGRYQEIEDWQNHPGRRP